MIGSTGLNIDSLVAQYRSSERRIIAPLEQRKTSLNARLNALSDLKTRLDALNKIVKDFASTTSSSKFSVFKVASSNADVATATATNGNSVGVHSLTVQQLAKQETVLSSRLQSGGTSVTDTVGTGTKQFAITINGTQTTVAVDVEDGDDNTAVLTKVAQAINGSGAAVNASVVSDTATTSRLVIKSAETGLDNAIELSSTTGGFLDAFGLTSEILGSRTGSTDSTAGYLHTSAGSLNSKFIIDGVTIERSGNSISDVLSGVTINLVKADENPVNLTVGSDVAKVRENVEEFIKKYNDAMSYLTSRTSVDPELKVRQIFAGDIQIRYLRMDLRIIAGGTIPGLDTSVPHSLADLGISIRADGTLNLSDTAKLDEVLKEDPNGAAAVFNSENGIAAQIQAKLDSFVSKGGMIDTTRDGTDYQLRNVNTRIKQVEGRIDARVARFRNEFVRLQNQIAIANQQMQMIRSLTNFF
jgi:flagellar hook-associated protein 2